MSKRMFDHYGGYLPEVSADAAADLVVPQRALALGPLFSKAEDKGRKEGEIEILRTLIKKAIRQDAEVGGAAA